MGQKFRKGRVSKICLCLTRSKAAFFFKFKKKIFISDKVISIIKIKVNALPWVHYFRWLSPQMEDLKLGTEIRQSSEGSFTHSSSCWWWSLAGSLRHSVRSSPGGLPSETRLSFLIAQGWHHPELALLEKEKSRWGEGGRMRIRLKLLWSIWELT